MAKLRYVSDACPASSGAAPGDGFVYRDPDGRPLDDPATLARIEALRIPPAWTDVWICPDPNGHLQAIGRDARGRKQYRYHPRWREVRDETKYGRCSRSAGAAAHPPRGWMRDLCAPGLPREKVLAAVVRLLETTLMRVGNGNTRSRTIASA